MGSDRHDTLRSLIGLCGYGQTPVSAEIDRSLADAAQREGLAPLLGRRCERNEVRTVDEGVANDLKEAYQRCVARNVHAEFVLERLYAALGARNVTPVLLKGAALVELVYGSPGERSMADVDLLVPADLWEPALEAALTVEAKPVDDPTRRVTMSWYHEVHLQLADGVMVDLHRRLSAWPLFRVGHAGIFARSTRADVGYLLPHPNDLFVSLAMHAAQDGFYLPGRAIVDGLALARHDQTLPHIVLERAAEWRARRATGLWLRTLERFAPPFERWSETTQRLDPKGRLAREARELPRRTSTLDRTQRQRLRWHVARSLDSPMRAGAFFALRGGLLVADWMTRLVTPRRSAA